MRKLFLMLLSCLLIALLVGGCTRTECPSDGDHSLCGVEVSCTQTGDCANCIKDRCGECAKALASDSECKTCDLKYYDGKVVKCEDCWKAKKFGGNCPYVVAGKCTWDPASAEQAANSGGCDNCAEAKKNDGECKDCEVQFIDGEKVKCKDCWKAKKDGGECKKCKG